MALIEVLEPAELRGILGHTFVVHRDTSPWLLAPRQPESPPVKIKSTGLQRA